VTRRWLVVAAAAVAAVLPVPAAAQTGPVAVRATADAGLVSFAAADSFDAVTGGHTIATWGGGVEAVLGRRIGVGVRGSRVTVDGERVFPFGGQVFRLNVPTRITVTPIEITGTFRLPRGRLVPYAGGGLGWHRYRETSAVSDPGEDVEQTTIGYHLVGGAEIRLSRWLGVAGEAQWTRVPGALAGGVADAFDEPDLGSAAVRVRVVVGR
jgi:hypothetical protein